MKMSQVLSINTYRKYHVHRDCCKGLALKHLHELTTVQQFTAIRYGINAGFDTEEIKIARYGFTGAQVDDILLPLNYSRD